MSGLLQRLTRRPIKRARFMGDVLAMRLSDCRFGLAKCITSVVLLGLAAIFSAPAHAQSIPVQYMVIPNPLLPLPPAPATYTLPGYGNVNVNWSVVPACLTFAYQAETPAYNQSAGTSPVYTWGTDTQDINMFNTCTSTASYTVTFTFLNGKPNLTNLILVICGLASGTTATVSQPGNLAGEYTIYDTSIPANTAPTEIDSTGTILSSGYPTHTTTSYKNTGWALFQVPPSSALLVSGGNPYLTVKFSQISADGIGTTLGYATEGTLKICKVAGSGVGTNTPFTFTVNSINQPALPAGPAPGGYCEVVQGAPTGTVAVAETNFSPYVVSNISVAGAGTIVGTPNLALGTVNVSLGSGVTEVTYTDTATGYLEICKVAGPGIAVGTNFNFMVGSTPFTVPAGPAPDGYCSPATQVAAGNATIVEEPPVPANDVVSCTAISPATCVSAGPMSWTVSVAPGGAANETIAVLTNCQQYVTPAACPVTGGRTTGISPAISGGKTGGRNAKKCDNPAICPQ